MKEKEDKTFSCPPQYELVRKETITELKSEGYILRHKKSGARVLLMCNDDENKVFSIGFRTPPKDSTGVAHIVEHTVLCGSERFPSKDPFTELAKGSLNTFLNAMTYPDKTIYPVASCNDKDFQNLMNVYLDAVFYPNIYKEEKIFKQEGWHYELENPEGEITYNGVVYNEMKGVYSSPEQKISHEIEKALYPESIYGLESGGDPEVIPELSYEEFLDFHRRYYHPSNSYIYLYGDMDMEEKLLWMDREYLGKFDFAPVDSEIRLQKPFPAMRHAEAVYSLTADEEAEHKTYLAYASVIGTCLDRNLYLAFQILEYLLLDTPGAPLRKALYDAELGSDVLSFYENGILQPTFAVMIKETDAEKADKFREVLYDTLSKIVEQGISEDSLQAAITMFEFRYREADFGRLPKGLVYGIQILDSWLYDDEKPFIHIRSNDTFSFLRKQIGTGYFEELIQTYLLDNQHAVLLIMRPERGLTEKLETHVRETLKKYKESLSEEELLALVEETKALKEYQQEPSKKEDLEKIPLLSVSDIKRTPEPLCNEKVDGFDCEVVHHCVETNGIGYFQLLFDTTNTKLEDAPYLGLLSAFLGEIDTEHYDLLKLSNEIDIHTGGMDIDTQIYKTLEKGTKEDPFHASMTVRLKALEPEFENAFGLLEEVLLHSLWNDEKRWKEIVGEERSRMQMFMMNSGNLAAMERAMSYHSKASCLNEWTDGIEYYRVLDRIYKNFDSEKEALAAKLQQLSSDVFVKSHLIISVTGNEECMEKAKLPVENFLKKLPESGKREELSLYDQIVPEKKKEGFMTAGQVQYVARTGNFRQAGFEFHGELRVLRTILSYEYLWNQVRVLGGAYDCRGTFGRDGNACFASYRDPNLKRTNDVYEKVWEFVRDFDVEEREMNKYIIGTISAMDTPLTPSAKGSRSLGAYLSGITEEQLKKEREEVLNTTVETIRKLAPLVKSITDADELCVVGSAGEIEKNKELFTNVEKLL